jgi:hypothetical protein
MPKKAETNACGKGNWTIKDGKIISKTEKGEIIKCTPEKELKKK